MPAKRTPGLCAALVLLFACGDADPRDATGGEPPETTMIPVTRPAATRDSLPARIFYDLTRFDWYARGEPLVWDDRDWQPRGAPVAARADALRRLGEFGGVDIWTDADADSVESLYVPVSEGFWLTFVPASR